MPTYQYNKQIHRLHNSIVGPSAREACFDIPRNFYTVDAGDGTTIEIPMSYLADLAVIDVASPEPGPRVAYAYAVYIQNLKLDPTMSKVKHKGVDFLEKQSFKQSVSLATKFLLGAAAGKATGVAIALLQADDLGSSSMYDIFETGKSTDGRTVHYYILGEPTR